jgi:cell division protein FtsL
MFISIVNIAFFVIILAIVIYIFLSYNSVRENINKMEKVIPDAVTIKDPLKSIVVPYGPLQA